jgi:hypothetical protein
VIPIGKPIVQSLTLSEIREHRKICVGDRDTQPCEYYFASQEMCTRCQCLVRVRTTTPGRHCPVGKW